jgi:hypothetical protein
MVPSDRIVRLLKRIAFLFIFTWLAAHLVAAAVSCQKVAQTPDDLHWLAP